MNAIAPKHSYTQKQLDQLKVVRPNLYKTIMEEGYEVLPEASAKSVVAASNVGTATVNPKAPVAKKAKKTMTPETTTPVANETPVAAVKKATKKAAPVKPVKKVVKKTTTVKEGKATTKTEVVKPTKKTAKAEPAPKTGIGKVHLKCLKALATSKTKVYPGVSAPGELKYSQLAVEAEVAINNLTQVMASASTKGTEYPNSLQSKGLVDCKTYELENGGQTSWLWFITPAGREFIKNLPKGL